MVCLREKEKTLNTSSKIEVFCIAVGSLCVQIHNPQKRREAQKRKLLRINMRSSFHILPHELSWLCLVINQSEPPWIVPLVILCRRWLVGQLLFVRDKAACSPPQLCNWTMQCSVDCSGTMHHQGHKKSHPWCRPVHCKL